MPFSVNVYNLKVNSIASNGSLNLGPVIHNSHSARSKLFGGNASVGDQSPTSALMNNKIADPDLIDQSDFLTSDTAYATQT
ncbi:MAG TPA: spore germination protein [Bacillales bacterium]|nr:spore germination protein [Bacillales bacterium]